MLFQYALNYLKRHQKQSVYLIMFMSFLSSLLIAVQISGASYKDELENNENAHYGIWQVELIHLNQEIDQSSLYKDQTHLLVYEVGTVSDKYFNLPLCFIEGDYETMLSYHLIEGRMPTAENEIAISERALFQLDLPGTLNQPVPLTVDGKTKEFILVGITDFYHDDKSNFYPQFIVCKQNYQNVNLFLADIQDSSFIDHFQYESIFYQPDKTHGLSSISTIYTNFKSGQYTVTVVLMTALCGSLLMMNFSYAAAKNRTKEYALLRGIGATKKQLYALSIIEITILFLISTLLGVPLSFLFCFIYSLLIPGVQMQNAISITEIGFYLLLTYSIVLFSHVHPVSKAVQNALTGTFDNIKEPLIHAHYKKLKVINARHLAIRYLKSHKKDTILFIILLTASLFSFHFMLNVNLTNQRIIDNLTELDNNCPYVILPKQSHFSPEEKSVISTSSFQTHLIEKYAIYDADNIQVSMSNGKDYQLADYYSYAFIPLTDDVIKLLETYGYDGKLPQNANEILSFEHLPHSLYDPAQKDYTVQDKQALKISYHGEKYQITGNVTGLDAPYPYIAMDTLETFYHYFPLDPVGSNLCFFYVLPDCPALNGLSSSEQVIAKDGPSSQELTAYFGERCQKIKYASHGFIFQQQTEYRKAINNRTRMFTIISGLLFLMCSLIHIQRIHQNRDDIAVFSLLGMTRKEIVKKYLWQSLFVAMIPMAVVIGIYLNSGYLLQGNCLLAVGLSFPFVILFYMLPVWMIVPKKGYDYLNQKEDY